MRSLHSFICCTPRFGDQGIGPRRLQAVPAPIVNRNSISPFGPKKRAHGNQHPGFFCLSQFFQLFGTSYGGLRIAGSASSADSLSTAGPATTHGARRRAGPRPIFSSCAKAKAPIPRHRHFQVPGLAATSSPPELRVHRLPGIPSSLRCESDTNIRLVAPALARGGETLSSLNVDPLDAIRSPRRPTQLDSAASSLRCAERHGFELRGKEERGKSTLEERGKQRRELDQPGGQQAPTTRQLRKSATSAPRPPGPRRHTTHQKSGTPSTPPQPPPPTQIEAKAGRCHRHQSQSTHTCYGRSVHGYLFPRGPPPPRQPTSGGGGENLPAGAPCSAGALIGPRAQRSRQHHHRQSACSNTDRRRRRATTC